ncbi:hypothetical protein B0H13DRAFT_1872510 [Mycena leptocephala]|nr:hypothetical protein B0H13DRAFT_1872510 [Mycena leptocephala]
MTLCRELQFLQLRWSSVATMRNSTADTIDIDTRRRRCGRVPVYPGVWYSMVNISASVVEINIDIYVSTVTVHRIPNHKSSMLVFTEEPLIAGRTPAVWTYHQFVALSLWRRFFISVSRLPWSSGTRPGI